jgi:hypothetical protein
MSDPEVRKLFAMVTDLTREIVKVKDEMVEVKRLVRLSAANAELVYEGYQQRGGEIERLERRMERLNIRCPLMKPPTDEFTKVP